MIAASLRSKFLQARLMQAGDSVGELTKKEAGETWAMNEMRYVSILRSGRAASKLKVLRVHPTPYLFSRLKRKNKANMRVH